MFCTLLVSCGITEVRGWGDRDEEQSDEMLWAGEDFPSQTVCFVTGFEYPAGYDWMSDDGSTQARCSLVVFADAVPRLKVPVGDGYQVSADHDMHRFLNGSLYTYFSKDGAVVIKKNGRPLCRYDADETMVDMSVDGEDLYILAHKSSGAGFSFRRNGIPILEKLSGEVLGGFWYDGQKPCFAYLQPVATAVGLENRYYIVSGASDPIHVPYGPDMGKVWDLRSQGGVPCSLVQRVSDGQTYIVKGGQSKVVTIPRQTEMLSCRMFQADGNIGVECAYLYPDGTCGGGIWVEGSEFLRFESGRLISYMSYLGGKAYCVMNSAGSTASNDSVGMIFDAGEIYRMPEGYMCIGYRPAAVHDGEFYVALSSREKEMPVIWHDGQYDALRMNGYVCSITFASGD